MAPKQRKPQVCRNPDLIRGIGKYSRSKMYHKRGLWAIKAKNGGCFPRHDKKPAADVPAVKPPSFTPPTMSRSLLSTSTSPSPPSSGQALPRNCFDHSGWKVQGQEGCLLKQLCSGLLLVTGPFKINGVPLRRVNQSYVIGTSTKVDISGVNVEKFDDKYFAKEGQKKKKKGEGEFFEAEKEDKNVLPQEKKDDQKTVDTPLIKAIEGVTDLKTYLAARFSLKQGMKPHELVF